MNTLLRIAGICLDFYLFLLGLLVIWATISSWGLLTFLVIVLMLCAAIVVGGLVSYHLSRKVRAKRNAIRIVQYWDPSEDDSKSYISKKEILEKKDGELRSLEAREFWMPKAYVLLIAVFFNGLGLYAVSHVVPSLWAVGLYTPVIVKIGIQYLKRRNEYEDLRRSRATENNQTSQSAVVSE